MGLCYSKVDNRDLGDENIRLNVLTGVQAARINVLQSECVALKKYRRVFEEPLDVTEYVISTLQRPDRNSDTERKYIMEILKCIGNVLNPPDSMPSQSTIMKTEVGSESI